MLNVLKYNIFSFYSQSAVTLYLIYLFILSPFLLLLLLWFNIIVFIIITTVIIICLFRFFVQLRVRHFHFSAVVYDSDATFTWNVYLCNKTDGTRTMKVPATISYYRVYRLYNKISVIDPTCC